MSGLDGATRGAAFLDALTPQNGLLAGLKPISARSHYPTRHDANSAQPSAAGWQKPEPPPSDLPPVEPFDMALMPDALRPWVQDICERVQCPPDFVAVTAIATAGSVIGRKLAIRPQMRTDWFEVPNLWALLIGRPSMMKSPAMSAALAPMRRLAARADEAHAAEMESYKAEALAAKLRAEIGEKEARSLIAKAMKSGADADVRHLLTTEEADAPTLRRYLCNDPSAAALGELLRQNPNGLAVVRDEVIGLLRSFERDDGAEARAFYLEGADGKNGFTFDRIGRGLNLHVPAVCISLIGCTQPGKIARFIKGAIGGGEGDDGLMQRFRLMVWPDDVGQWRNVDRWPDSAARNHAFAAFEALDTLDPDAICVERDEHESVPFLRFSPEAHEAFLEWRNELETELRGGKLHPAMESHLAKWRKLVPVMALIQHLADGGRGPVTTTPTLRALAWSEYLRSHAERVYASVAQPQMNVARAIARRIQSGDLAGTVRVRDLHRKGWSGLSDRAEIAEGLEVLADFGWLELAHHETGGRLSQVAIINPLAREGV